MTYTRLSYRAPCGTDIKFPLLWHLHLYIILIKSTFFHTNCSISADRRRTKLLTLAPPQSEERVGVVGQRTLRHSGLPITEPKIERSECIRLDRDVVFRDVTYGRLCSEMIGRALMLGWRSYGLKVREPVV